MTKTQSATLTPLELAASGILEIVDRANAEELLAHEV